MEKKQFSVRSSDNIHDLQGVVYLPKGKAKGFLHIVHGMTEHIGRYDRFMSEMTEEGYICFGYDHLGHGYTAANDGELGYIAKKEGDDLLARDVKVFSDAVISAYKSEDGEILPYYLLGHSMGSFVTRVAVSEYLTPDKYVIMGTAGKNSAADAGLALIAIVKLFCSDHHFSPLIDNIAFGSYNKRFGGGTADDPSPWLTSDEEVRKRYYADKFCTFKFTVSAMGDLIRLIKRSNSKRWYEKMPKTLPILLVSGEEDPVGNYGKGVKEVHEGLLKCGCNAQCIIYPKARHEILNDFTYEKVKEDVLLFLES